MCLACALEGGDAPNAARVVEARLSDLNLMVKDLKSGGGTVGPGALIRPAHATLLQLACLESVLGREGLEASSTVLRRGRPFLLRNLGHALSITAEAGRPTQSRVGEQLDAYYGSVVALLRGPPRPAGEAPSVDGADGDGLSWALAIEVGLDRLRRYFSFHHLDEPGTTVDALLGRVSRSLDDTLATSSPSPASVQIAAIRKVLLEVDGFDDYDSTALRRYLDPSMAETIDVPEMSAFVRRLLIAELLLALAIARTEAAPTIPGSVRDDLDTDIERLGTTIGRLLRAADERGGRPSALPGLLERAQSATLSAMRAAVRARRAARAGSYAKSLVAAMRAIVCLEGVSLLHEAAFGMGPREADIWDVLDAWTTELLESSAATAIAAQGAQGGPWDAAQVRRVLNATDALETRFVGMLEGLGASSKADTGYIRPAHDHLWGLVRSMVLARLAPSPDPTALMGVVGGSTDDLRDLLALRKAHGRPPSTRQDAWFEASLDSLRAMASPAPSVVAPQTPVVETAAVQEVAVAVRPVRPPPSPLEELGLERILGAFGDAPRLVRCGGLGAGGLVAVLLPGTVEALEGLEGRLGGRLGGSISISEDHLSARLVAVPRTDDVWEARELAREASLLQILAQGTPAGGPVTLIAFASLPAPGGPMAILSDTWIVSEERTVRQWGRREAPASSTVSGPMDGLHAALSRAGGVTVIRDDGGAYLQGWLWGLLRELRLREGALEGAPDVRAVQLAGNAAFYRWLSEDGARDGSFGTTLDALSQGAG